MRSLTITELLFLCVVTACFGAQQEVPAFLSVSSSPDGLELFVDGVLKGRTPVDSVKVQPGNHVVEVLGADRYQWTATRIVDSISVAAGEWRTIHLSVRDEVVVLSEPSDAEVISGGVILGRTPYRTFTNASSQALVWKIRKDGFQPSTVRLEPDSTQTVFASLEPLGSQQEMREVLEGAGAAGIRDEQWSIATGAIMVASGVAAAYFKDRANQAYGTYQRTQDPQALKDIRRYDRWSGFASLTTQISFAAFAYLLMAK